jgi:hypothetical protein
MPYRQQGLIWRSRHNSHSAYMTRIFSLFAILLLFGIFLNGCSSPDNEEQPDTISDFPPEPTAAPSEATEKTEAIDEITPADTVEPAAYPVSTATMPQTPSPASYPQAYEMPGDTAAADGTVIADAGTSVFLPIMGGSSITPTPEPTQTP